MLFSISAEPISGLAFGPQYFTALMAAMVAAVLVAVILPFSCSFLLDGLVLLARGKGPRGLIDGAVAVAAVVAAAGLLLAIAGSAPESSSTIFNTATSFLAPWAVVAALGAFLLRQARQVLRRR